MQDGHRRPLQAHRRPQQAPGRHTERPFAFSTAPKCQVCVNFNSQGVCNANDACRFKASHGPLPTAVHQAYDTWQKDNRATA